MVLLDHFCVCLKCDIFIKQQTAGCSIRVKNYFLNLMLISMNTVLYHKEKERSGAVTHGFSLSLSLSHTHPPTSMTHKFRNAQSSVVRGFSHKLIHTLSHTLLLPWYTHTLSLFYFHGVHMHTHSHTVLHFHGAHTHTLFYFHGVHTHAHTHTCTPMVLLPT